MHNKEKDDLLFLRFKRKHGICPSIVVRPKGTPLPALAVRKSTYGGPVNVIVGDETPAEFMKRTNIDENYLAKAAGAVGFAFYRRHAKSGRLELVTYDPKLEP